MIYGFCRGPEQDADGQRCAESNVKPPRLCQQWRRFFPSDPDTAFTLHCRDAVAEQGFQMLEDLFLLRHRERRAEVAELADG